MCLVLSELDIFPLVARRMHNLLSWYRMLWVTVYPCASIKYLPYMISGIQSLIPIRSALVELCGFNFCPCNRIIAAPLPMVIIMPVWHFKSS